MKSHSLRSDTQTYKGKIQNNKRSKSDANNCIFTVVSVQGQEAKKIKLHCAGEYLRTLNAMKTSDKPMRCMEIKPRQAPGDYLH